MRVNVYSEEITDRAEVVTETIGRQKFTGIRFFLELPATVGGQQYRGPFTHRPGDDDSSAVTFWATDADKLRDLLRTALSALDG
jgi:hypothetical protein